MDMVEREVGERPFCPKDRTRQCIIPGPINGGCCRYIPEGEPVGFSVIWRNDNHWDIGTRWGRAFRIRGEPGEVLVADEREDDARPFPRDWLKFRTVTAALAWCADELMHPAPARAALEPAEGD